MKPFYKSRTIWLAIIQALLGISIVFATEYNAEGALLLLKSAYDIILRFRTSESIM